MQFHVSALATKVIEHSPERKGGSKRDPLIRALIKVKEPHDVDERRTDGRQAQLTETKGLCLRIS